uniref:RRM domain-containing protein n=1 Tax=Populus davidiana TaxID=266767 RepID=A0A6M2EK75_9ROSI
MSHGHHQPYDPYYQLPPAAAAPGGEWNSGINTLFVSGLPDDVKAREIHNIFRRRPGFDSCQLKYTGRGNQVVAFATFFNHQSAIAALHSLNGVKFDPQSGSTLHIELARSNSRRKRKPGSGAYVVIDKRTKKPSDAHETSSDDGESDPDEDPEMNNVDTAYQGDSENAKSEAASDPDNAAVAVNEIGERTAEGGLRPCSTLFIANLGPNCTEDELKQVLSQYPGFHVLKIRAKGGMPVAFADFEEIEQATKVMENLQDTTLPSSDRGGMHIEYARSKMRKP